MIGLRVAALASLVGLGLAAGAWAQPAGTAAEQAAPRPLQIDRNGVLILIRSNLLALNQANETGNYTVLRDLAAPGFREANTAARLGEIFASQRSQKLDLSGVAVLEPQLTVLPQIEAGGLMRLAGFFPSVPSQVNFEMLFAAVEGRWRVFGIAVTIGSSTPAAPPSPPAPVPVQDAPAPASPSAAAKPAEPGHAASKAPARPAAGRAAKPVEPPQRP